MKWALRVTQAAYRGLGRDLSRVGIGGLLAAVAVLGTGGVASAQEVAEPAAPIALVAEGLSLDTSVTVDGTIRFGGALTVSPTGSAWPAGLNAEQTDLAASFAELRGLAKVMLSSACSATLDAAADAIGLAAVTPIPVVALGELASTTAPIVIVSDPGAITVTVPAAPADGGTVAESTAATQPSVWMFPGASSVTIDGLFNGSVFAPNAIVNLHGGVTGRVAARSLSITNGTLLGDSGLPVVTCDAAVVPVLEAPPTTLIVPETTSTLEAIDESTELTSPINPAAAVVRGGVPTLPVPETILFPVVSDPFEEVPFDTVPLDPIAVFDTVPEVANPAPAATIGGGIGIGLILGKPVSVFGTESSVPGNVVTAPTTKPGGSLANSGSNPMPALLSGVVAAAVGGLALLTVRRPRRPWMNNATK